MTSPSISPSNSSSEDNQVKLLYDYFFRCLATTGTSAAVTISLVALRSLGIEHTAINTLIHPVCSGAFALGLAGTAMFGYCIHTKLLKKLNLLENRVQIIETGTR